MLVAAVLVVALPACSKPGSVPRSAAEAFLDAHYVRIDLTAAETLASGLARDKVEKEIALTKGQEINRETLQPRVTYKLQRADETKTVGQYAYELTIRAPGADPFHKLVTVTVRSLDGAWSVTNYSEGDAAGDAPPSHPD